VFILSFLSPNKALAVHSQSKMKSEIAKKSSAKSNSKVVSFVKRKIFQTKKIITKYKYKVAKWIQKTKMASSTTGTFALIFLGLAAICLIILYLFFGSVGTFTLLFWYFVVLCFGLTCFGVFLILFIMYLILLMQEQSEV